MDKRISTARELMQLCFPEMADVEPSVTITEHSTTIFTYRKTFQTADGLDQPKVIRITLKNTGRVLKIASSSI